MKILAIEHEIPNLPEEAFTPQILRKEAAHTWELYQQGFIREIYFHRDQHVAVLMLECSDVESAHQVLEQLPLVRSGLITFELMPLIAYPGFARLFAESQGGSK